VVKTAFTEAFKIHTGRQVNMQLAANMLGVGRVADAVEFRAVIRP
jgi:glutamate dehydrogenase/leucine dehydrogenase